MTEDESEEKGDSGSSLKQGTGTDPWEDDEPDTQTTETQTTTGNEPAEPSTTSESMSTDSPTDESPASDQHSVDNEIPHTGGQYPYLLARDSVSDGRDAATLSLPISSETQKIYNRVIFELDNERFDADIQNTDVAIASMLVGLEHIDEIENILREWGYGIET